MPDYDRQLAQQPGLVHPPTPDEEELMALHCADQYRRGHATPAQALEAMRMLGIEDAAIGIVSRRHAWRGDKARAAEQAQVLAIRTAKKKRRRAS